MTTIIVTHPPAVEPIDVPTCKAQLRIEHDAEDTLLAMYIQAAREAAERKLDRRLITTELVAQFGSTAAPLQLLQGPVQAVAQVQYHDASGALQTLDPASYTLVTATPVPELVLADGVASGIVATAAKPLLVRYAVGYGDAPADVPAPIRQWLLLAVGDMYALRARSGERPAVPHDFADELLAPYKVWGL